MIGAIVDLDTAGNEELYIPVTGGQHLLDGRNFPDKAGHNN